MHRKKTSRRVLPCILYICICILTVYYPCPCSATTLINMEYSSTSGPADKIISNGAHPVCFPVIVSLPIARRVKEDYLIARHTLYIQNVYKNTDFGVPNCLWKQRSAQELFVGSFMKWVSQLHTSLRSPCTMPSVVWSGVKLGAMGAFEMRSLEGWIMHHHLALQCTHLGLVDARRTLSALMHSVNCKVWWRRNNGLGLFLMVRVRPRSSSEGKS